MSNTHRRHMLALRRQKIRKGWVLLLWVLSATLLFSQAPKRGKDINLQQYDQVPWHFGFLFGIHISRYELKYADAYLRGSLATLHSVHARNSPGFKVGFIANYRLHNQLNLRFIPTVAFYEDRVEYQYTTGEVDTQLNEVTQIELPILLKYKSERRSNTRVYMLAGISPSVEARSNEKKNAIENSIILKTNEYSVAAEFGVGIDIYLPYFKFSPEVRYGFGLVNTLYDEENKYTLPLKRLVPHHFTFYLTFEGST